MTATPTTPRDSAIGGYAVTPDDDTDLPRQSRALAWDVAGDIAVVWADGTENIIPSGLLAPQVMHAVQIRRVKSTGTDSGLVIWAFY